MHRQMAENLYRLHFQYLLDKSLWLPPSSGWHVSYFFACSVASCATTMQSDLPRADVLLHGPRLSRLSSCAPPMGTCLAMEKRLLERVREWWGVWNGLENVDSMKTPPQWPQGGIDDARRCRTSPRNTRMPTHSKWISHSRSCTRWSSSAAMSFSTKMAAVRPWRSIAPPSPAAPRPQQTRVKREHWAPHRHGPPWRRWRRPATGHRPTCAQRGQESRTPPRQSAKSGDTTPTNTTRPGALCAAFGRFSPCP